MLAAYNQWQTWAGLKAAQRQKSIILEIKFAEVKHMIVLQPKQQCVGVSDVRGGPYLLNVLYECEAL